MDKKEISETPQGDLATEAGLGWPAGTIECLRKAFAAGRRRGEPWDFSGVPEGRKAAWAQAAAVFRRGGVTAGEEPSMYRRAELIQAASVTQVVNGFDAKSRHRVFVIDDAVNARWPVLQQLRARFPVWIFSGGEVAKNLETTSRLTAWIRANAGNEMSGCQVVAIGGGVTMDLAGFAAGICGLEHVNVPTTLLAMVDAAIGGKTGVNFPPYGKNQVGLFHFPGRVIICPEFLKTLPVEEFRAGAAECLKHALLASDFYLFDKWVQLARDGHRIVTADVGSIVESIVTVARMKESFIDQDPHERSGARELLNLGHTIAHAIESVAQSTGHVVRHGAAVALGLACKAELMSIAQPDASVPARRIIAGLRESQCLDELRGWISGRGQTADALWPSVFGQMLHDKKMRAGDQGGIRVVGLFWNPDRAIIGTQAIQVEPDDLRRAFVNCLQALR
jgi:3-dehydroquinate synthetase